MSNKAQNKAIQIYQTIQSQLPKPEMIVFNDPHSTDQYKFGVVKLDENFYYDGVVRGNRPDGIGIMTDKRQLFSVRGRFANTKLCGAGRVELEQGEIYDGVFRNGIFCSGICYNSKEDRFIYGNFKTPEIKILLKGKGYPYQLFLNNKEKLYDSTLVYKTTCSEIVFAPQEDRHLVREFDRFKYNLDMPSSRSSYQESIFETTERENNLSIIQDEMNMIQQDELYHKIDQNNIEIFDNETKQLIEQTQNSIQQNNQEYYLEKDYDEIGENIKKKADFNHQNQEQYEDELIQISQQREQRMKQMREQSNQSYTLIESLRNQLNTYEQIKRNNQIQQLNYNQEYSQNNDIAEFPDEQFDEQYQFQNRSNNLPCNFSDRFEQRYQDPQQNNSQNQLLDSNKFINEQQLYLEQINVKNENQLNNRFKQTIADNFNQQQNLKHQQRQGGSQTLQESINSQNSFATFSNKKSGLKLFYQDTEDEEEQHKHGSFNSNECMKIQINQSINLNELQEEPIQKYKNIEQKNDNKIVNTQLQNNQNNVTKIIITDLTAQNLAQNQNQQETSQINQIVKDPETQKQQQQNNSNLLDINQDSDSQDFFRFSQQQLKIDKFKEKLQKQLNDQEVRKRNESYSIDFHKSQVTFDDESKDFDRIRQRSQFSVDFDPNLIQNNKQLEQEMIENYFENLKAQFTDKNQNNSTGTISALHDILSDQNYQSKGRTEDYSLMQILDDKITQNRSQSNEKANLVQRKFLDSSIQYLESDHNINFRDSQNNSCFNYSLDRSGRKTIDKSNPSQFQRYTQNSLSEKNDEENEGDEQSLQDGFQIKNKEKSDSVIEDDINSIEDRNYSANDQAFINSNLNLTELDQ